MKDESKTKKQLISELDELRRQLAHVQSSAEEFQQLKESNEKFVKAFLQNSIPMDITLLRSGRYVDVSEALLIFMGRRRDEVIGNTATSLELITEEQKSIFLNELNSKGRVENLELQVKTKGGELRDGLFNAVMMTLNNEKYLLTVMADITDRKRAEKTLHESEEKSRALTESTSMGIYLIQNNKFVYINPSFQSITGYSQTELDDMLFWNIVHPDFREMVKDRGIKRQKGEEVPQRYDFKIIAKGGQEKWIDLSVTYIDLNGKPTIMGSMSDITERKRMEDALRESEVHVRTILENAPLGIVNYDKNGAIIDCNANFIQLIGSSREALLGLNVLKLKNEDVANALRISLNGHISAVEGEYRSYTADKVTKARMVCAPFFSQKGEITGGIAITEDITSRRRAEEALRETEDKYRLLVDNASDIICRTDSRGYFNFLNPAAMKFTGYAEADLIGKHFSELIHPDWRADVERFCGRQFVKNIPSACYDVPLLTKDNRQAWLEQNVQLIIDNGQVVGFQAIARDITDRKQAQEALRESEEKYRAILQSIEDGYFESDLAGCFTFFNDSLCKILGYSRDELIGMNNRRLLDKENARKVFAIFNKVYTTGKAYRPFEWKFITKEGVERFAESSISLKRDREGRPTGFQGIVREVTERKRMEDKLKESEEKFRILMESSPTAFLMYQNNTWVYANPAATEITGYTSQELRDMPFAYFAHPDDKAMLQERAQRRQRGEIKTNLRYEVRIIAKDGTIKWIDLSSTSVFHKACPAGVVSVVDITERKRMEAELLKARKLESVATLAGGIAHDFNNLLAGVYGYIEMAQLDLPSGSRAHDYLLAAEKSAKQAADLTKRLITFARGGGPVRKQSDIGELVKDTVQRALIAIPVEKKVVVADDLWTAEIDAGQIRQAIISIIANAVEAMPEGGLLTVSAQNVIVFPNQLPVSEGPYVRITVSDTGGGISAEDLPLIFDPYFSRKQRGTQKGMGMGLSVCHSIVSKHNGCISVESTPGRGSSFYVYLPAITRVKSEERAPRQQSMLDVQRRILVMDDEEVIREMIEELLKTMGCQVTTVQDGLSAIDLYIKARETDQSYDLLILDLTIKGGIGGVETMKRLREIDPEVKAIIFSG